MLNKDCVVGKRYILVCWKDQATNESLSVTAVPASRVSTGGLLDSSVGES